MMLEVLGVQTWTEAVGVAGFAFMVLVVSSLVAAFIETYFEERRFEKERRRGGSSTALIDSLKKREVRHGQKAGGG